MPPTASAIPPQNTTGRTEKPVLGSVPVPPLPEMMNPPAAIVVVAPPPTLAVPGLVVDVEVPLAGIVVVLLVIEDVVVAGAVVVVTDVEVVALVSLPMVVVVVAGMVVLVEVLVLVDVLVGASEIGGAVIGGIVIGGTVTGGRVMGGTVVGAIVIGGTVMGGTVVLVLDEVVLDEVVLEEVVLEEVVGVGAHTGLVTVLESSVTAPFRANRRPCTVALVFAVIEVKARMVPMKVEPTPSVAELPTCQKTLQGWAPLMSITLLLGAVIKVDPAWKIQTAFGSPWASRVRVPVMANASAL